MVHDSGVNAIRTESSVCTRGGVEKTQLANYPYHFYLLMLGWVFVVGAVLLLGALLVFGRVEGNFAEEL